MIEKERKFLVTEEALKREFTKSQVIWQVYSSPTMRHRMVIEENGWKWFITEDKSKEYKKDRTEKVLFTSKVFHKNEYTDYDAIMLQLAERYPSIYKIRKWLDDDGLVVIDIFPELQYNFIVPLKILEIEGLDIAPSIETIREVTGQKEFYSRHIAERIYCQSADIAISAPESVLYRQNKVPSTKCRAEMKTLQNEMLFGGDKKGHWDEYADMEYEEYLKQEERKTK